MKIRILLWIPVLLFMPLCFWSCNGSRSESTGYPRQAVYERDPNLNPPGVFPINKTKVPLKIGIERTNVVEDWKTNWMTRQIEENGNYDLTFEVYPAGELPQKFELMVMAGGRDLPDIMMFGVNSISVETLTRYGQAGMIVPVNDYYKNSAYFINESMKEIDLDCLQYVTSFDGNIYGVYGILESLNNEYASARIMIYEPWLHKLGLSMPQTVDEYLNVLRAFRDRDPNGNGLKDEIPLAGSRNNNIGISFLKVMMTPFIYCQDNFWILDNGRIDVAFNKPQWRDGLRFIKQLVDEELLSRLSFTQDNTQLVSMIRQDPPKVGSYVGSTSSFLGVNDTKRIEYVILSPLEGPGGRQQVWRPSLPGIRMVITRNCKNPEAAFMLGDYMCSEEMSVATRWGEKGVDWLEPGPDDKSVYDSLGYPATMIPVTPWGVVQNKWWAQVGPHIVPVKWAAGMVSTGGLDHNIPLGRTMGPAVQYANRNPVMGLVFNEREQEIMTDLHQTILSYVMESYARFVIGDLSIDRDWDAYVAEFKKMGLEDVIRATQSAWDRMHRE